MCWKVGFVLTCHWRKLDSTIGPAARRAAVPRRARWISGHCTGASGINPGEGPQVRIRLPPAGESQSKLRFAPRASRPRTARPTEHGAGLNGSAVRRRGAAPPLFGIDAEITRVVMASGLRSVNWSPEAGLIPRFGKHAVVEVFRCHPCRHGATLHQLIHGGEKCATPISSLLRQFRHRYVPRRACPGY